MVKAVSVQDLAKVAAFYDQRFAEQGEQPSSVGWRDQQSQYLRFDYLFQGYDGQHKTILDVGCGFADLYHYLFKKYGNRFHYIGIDTSAALLSVAKKHCHAQNSEFFHGDLHAWYQQASKNKQSIDFAVESGMLSFKLDNNNDYAQQIMALMYELANDGIAMNFLSDQVDYQLDKNHHFSAQQVLHWASGLSRHWVIYQDYPLWEFTLQLYKSAKQLRGL